MPNAALRLRAAAITLASLLAFAGCSAAEIATPPAHPHAAVADHGPLVLTPLMPVLLARASLESLDLAPATRDEVRRVESDLFEATARVRTERGDLLRDLADGVDRHMDAVSKSIEASASGLESAAERLFKTLTPAQRQETSQALTARWQSWNASWGVLDQEPRASTWQPEGALREIAEEIGLTPAAVQGARERLAASVAPASAPSDEIVRAAYVTVTTAFARPTADALVASVVVCSATAARMSVARAARLVEALLPGLTAGQRTVLASLLRERADHVD
jgi:hypothetical protein